MRSRLVIAGLIAASVVGIAGLWWWMSASDPLELRTVSDPYTADRPAPPDGAPNVVVVIGCTLRRDQLSVYRPELGTTPFLAELGARGTVFDDAITAAPWTRPASAAIFSGTHAVHLGMVEPGPGLSHRALPEAALTMAEYFRGQGYRTLGGTANPNTGSVWRMNQGFDWYVEPAGLWADGHLGKQRAGPVRDALLAEIAASGGDRPLYLQLMFIEAHSPWRPVAESVVEGDRSVPEEVHRYRGEVLAFDQQVRALHEGLADLGLTDRDTIFVVLNDHGEGLSWPQHHGAAHGRYLFPSTVGGVWLMTGPGVPTQRVSGVVSQVDVFPTLADLAGFPLARAIDGVSLVPALRSGRSPHDAVFSDTWFASVERSAVYTERVACQRDWSGAEAGGRFVSGCFDRFADPEHARPGPNPALAEELERWKAAAMERMASATGATDVDPDAATLDQLEKLGYVE